MSILDQFKIQQKYNGTIPKLIHALLTFRTAFLMNQRTIADATWHNCYRNSTSPRFIVELSILFVNFEL